MFDDFLNTASSLYGTYTQAQINDLKAQTELQAQQNAAAAQLQRAQNQQASQNLRQNLITGGFIVLGVLVTIWVLQRFKK